MKTQVYRWRIPSNLKADLDREARGRNTSVSSILELAVRNWLDREAHGRDDEEEQRRFHQAAVKCIGTISGNDPDASTKAREAVRERLRQKYGRCSPP